MHENFTFYTGLCSIQNEPTFYCITQPSTEGNTKQSQSVHGTVKKYKEHKKYKDHAADSVLYKRNAWN